MERGCRNCMWLYHMVTYNPTAPCSECLDHDKWQTTKRSNADRIRGMSDEELADKFEEIQLNTVKAYGNDDLLLKGELKKYWLDWLRQEADE